MIYLVIISIFLVSVFLYLLIELKRSIHLIYVIPLSIIFTAGSYFYLDSLFGYPVAKTNEEKFYLLSYYIAPEETTINMWVILEKETVPKAIVLPYDQETHEALEEVRKRMGEGDAVMGEFNITTDPGTELEGATQDDKQSSGGTRKSAGGAFNILNLDLSSKLPPKDQYVIGDD